jgi:GT2 family glycosyltransferase
MLKENFNQYILGSKVVIITLNFNQNDYTLKFVESLLKSDYLKLVLLLVDNGSTEERYNDLKETIPDDTRIILKRITINCGYVGGINYGLEQGILLNPDYFLIINNDTIINEKAVSELVKTCKSYSDKAIVTGKVYHYEEPDKLQDIGYTFANKKQLIINRIGANEIDRGQYNEIAERDLLDDVYWLFPTELYHKIGGYSRYFWFNAEQADFAVRAKKAGYKLIYTPEAKLWHKGSVSIGGRNMNPSLVYWDIQSSLIFRHLHISKFQLILFFFSVIDSIFRSYFKCVISLFRGKRTSFNYANAKLSGMLYYLKWIFIKNENSGINPFYMN